MQRSNTVDEKAFLSLDENKNIVNNITILSVNKPLHIPPLFITNTIPTTIIYNNIDGLYSPIIISKRRMFFTPRITSFPISFKFFRLKKK